MKRIPAFILFVILFYPGLIYASSIAIKAGLEASFLKDHIEVMVDMKNMGDANALKVFPELKLGQHEKRLNPVPLLAPNSSHRWTQRFRIDELGFRSKGSYPLFLKIHYHDNNMYPFSMPRILLLYYKTKPPDPPVEATFSMGKIRHTGKAKVSLSNLSGRDLSGTLDLFLPDELVSRTPKALFQLVKGEKLSLTFQIENDGALKGSQYRVYAVVRTVLSGIHQTLAIPKIIEVGGYMDTGVSSSRIAGGIIFLFALFISTIYFELKKGGRSG